MTINEPFSRRSFLRSIATLAGGIMLPVSFPNSNSIKQMKISDKITPIVRSEKISVIGIGSYGTKAVKILEKEHLMNFSPRTILPNVKKNENDLIPAFIITGPDGFFDKIVFTRHYQSL